MSNKGICILIAIAVVLGLTAWGLSSGSKGGAPAVNGRQVFPKLEIAKVASIEVGDRLKLAAGDEGWTVATYHNYPADRSKISANLLKLAELKVGQSVRGKTIEKPTELTLKDAAGGTIASLPLGERHAKWGHGRYAKFAGETVLLSDGLDAFEGDGKSWVETKIVDEPWISFNDVVEGVDEAEFGFATGVVAKVTVAGDTNRVATIGNVVNGGVDRYFKLDNSKWVYRVSSYSVDKLLPKPAPEGEKDEAKEPEAKVEAPVPAEEEKQPESDAK